MKQKNNGAEFKNIVKWADEAGFYKIVEVVDSGELFLSVPISRQYLALILWVKENMCELLNTFLLEDPYKLEVEQWKLAISEEDAKLLANMQLVNWLGQNYLLMPVMVLPKISDKAVFADLKENILSACDDQLIEVHNNVPDLRNKSPISRLGRTQAHKQNKQQMLASAKQNLFSRQVFMTLTIFLSAFGFGIFYGG